MKVSGNLTVKVESEDGDVTITFREYKMNENLLQLGKIQAMPEGVDKNRAFVDYQLGKVVSIDGLEDDEGPVTVERLKALGVIPEVLHVVTKALAGNKDEAEEKKAASEPA